MKFLTSLGSGRKKRHAKGVSLNVGGFAQKSKWRPENSPRTVTRLLVIGVFLAIAAGILFTTIRQSWAFITDNPLYAIRTIDIPDPVYLTVQEVMGLSGVSKGENILRCSIKDVQKRLLEHPNIKSAVVKRILPATLCIEIKEREPVAQINIGKNYLIDSEGTVLTWSDKFAAKSWTLIDGVDLKSKVVDNRIGSEPLMEVLQILKAFRTTVLAACLDITRVDMAAPGGYLFETSKGVSFRFGFGLEAPDIQEKFGQLTAVLDDLQKKSVAAEVVDLRFNDVVVTTKQANAKTPAKDGKAANGAADKDKTAKKAAR